MVYPKKILIGIRNSTLEIDKALRIPEQKYSRYRWSQDKIQLIQGNLEDLLENISNLRTVF